MNLRKRKLSILVTLYGRKYWGPLDEGILASLLFREGLIVRFWEDGQWQYQITRQGIWKLVA